MYVYIYIYIVWRQISNFCVLAHVMEHGMFGEQPTFHCGLCILSVLFCFLRCLCGTGCGGVVVLL
jgi:hypothetical protein